ncbi:cytochrome P450 [Allonocardiopsis opalescens]|uniref:Fatty-acid peroxygenase n=1 Tax=Allonocardiopsis opalescens TaxID=1144618 RepID=A0A2T0Q7L0_9ACTN|nr:cytochrome P450 [Allonocardiopsis opalescens]PRX99825.1 fatty-acid peroxygenase [Allonocardiopsis opalescens]
MPLSDALNPSRFTDDTVPLLVKGYAWLPDRRRRAQGAMVRTRLLARPTVALRGPEAARFFYDEAHVRRHGAIPEPVQSTLFGHGAVHDLDGAAHRVRKSLFTSLMTADRVTALADGAASAWDRAVQEWAEQPRIVLFDEAARVLTAAVYDWTGVPLDPADLDGTAQDLVAMVDGFATPGPRHWRARRTRTRQERRTAAFVAEVRRGAAKAPADSPADAVLRHHGVDGEALDTHTAGVELLNLLRPTVAVSWFVAYAAHALHRWPEHRARLRDGDGGFATAFAHEIRRFYPFAPFVGGRAVRDLDWQGEHIPAGATVLLDVYGQNHDPALWDRPYAFRPQRFADGGIDPFTLIPQGGGDPGAGHRCPGEDITVAVLRTLAIRLARLDYRVPEQNLAIPLHRIPSRPLSGMVLADVRAPG